MFIFSHSIHQEICGISFFSPEQLVIKRNCLNFYSFPSWLSSADEYGFQSQIICFSQQIFLFFHALCKERKIMQRLKKEIPLIEVCARAFVCVCVCIYMCASLTFFNVKKLYSHLRPSTKRVFQKRDNTYLQKDTK